MGQWAYIPQIGMQTDATFLKGKLATFTKIWALCSPLLGNCPTNRKNTTIRISITEIEKKKQTETTSDG